ncbi:MAG: hypothetical protein ABIS21_08530 [Acidimicrobiales bacterium]
MGLVAVETAVATLVAVAGFGVDGGDDPVFGHAPHDAEYAVVVLGHVLAGDEGQQLGGITSQLSELDTVDHCQCGQGVTDQLIDESLSGSGVIPITGRLAGGGVVVVSGQCRPHPNGQGGGGVVEHHQQLADGGPQLGHGVLGGHRVIQRSGVEHPRPTT